MTAISIITYFMAIICGVLIGWLFAKPQNKYSFLMAFISIAAVTALALVIGIVSTENDFSVEAVKNNSAKCLSQSGVYDANSNTCWRNGEKI